MKKEGTVKIILPATLADYTVRQAIAAQQFFSIDPNKREKKLLAIIELISIASGLPEETLKKVPISKLQEAYEQIIKALSVERKAPPKFLKINGKDYFFESNLQSSDWSGGRYVDCDNAGTRLEEEPELIAAICYIEKGSCYGDKPLNERAEVFKTEFPGDVFLDLIAFFLQKNERLRPAFLVLQVARARTLKKKALKTTQDGGLT